MVNKRDYSIGGLQLRFSGWLPQANEDDWLPMFQTEQAEPDIEISISKVSDIEYPVELQPNWEEAYLRCCLIGNEIHRYYRRDRKQTGADYAHLSYDLSCPQLRQLELCDRGFELNEKQLLTCIGSEDLLLQFDRAIFHSSCVETADGAILFSGVSGIGKSTQAALWEQYAGATVKNGDRNLLHIQNDAAVVCGLPYAGTSGICNRFLLPIRAIVFLGQAKSNALTRLQPREAMKHILSQLPVPKWNAAAIGKAMDLAAQLASRVSVYKLDCLPDASSVKLLQQTLIEEQ